ncbi:MAG: hypothetical protein H0W63_04065 [Gemmatimonadaceae bacterium]|nr:hypothetical protein [Gemmatimonadaceae bacterium]
MAVPFELVDSAPQLEVRSLGLTGWSVPPGWYGKVEAAGIGIVRRAHLEEVAGLDALERLGNTDPQSRSPNYEGRRLVRVEGGFIVLNFIDYRDKDSTNAERQQRYRERQRALKKEREEKAKALRELPVTVTEKRVTITQQLDNDYDGTTNTKETTTALVEPNSSSTGKSMVRVGKGSSLAEITETLVAVNAGTRQVLKKQERRSMGASLVFAYWAAKANHTGALLDRKRERTITARLEEGKDNLNEMLYVVDGLLRDDNLMGRRNDSNRKYDGIETIFRDRAQVERLAALGGYREGATHPMVKKYADAVGATEVSNGEPATARIAGEGGGNGEG